MGRRRRFLNGVLEISEILFSATVHLLCGLYIFSTAVASDISQALLSAATPPTTTTTQSVEVEKTTISVASPFVESDGGEGDGNGGSSPPPPIVLVHGIFGFGKGRLGRLSYFGGAEKKDDRVLVPDLGSLTSIHDRARELFYYLKGGRVDYGEEHSRIYGHSRFGRFYEQGNFPDWDDQHPVHFVGHSAGAQVVRLLQQMLADKAFEGHENTSEDWILSLTSLSGALNGTTRTYIDGMQPENGRFIKPVSLLQLCRLGVVLYEWFDISWLKNYYSFGFDHFDMVWHKCGLSGLFDCLWGNGGPFASGDWILPDLTIQGSLLLNSNLCTFPDTYYFSYATKRTQKFGGVTLPSSVRKIHPLLFLRMLQMSQWHHPTHAPLLCKGYRDEDWQDNDGAVNTISMTHPLIPVEHPSHFVKEDSECHHQPLQPGIWYYKILEADHIFFVLNRDRAGVQFDMMYDSIFQRCRKHVIRASSLPKLQNTTTTSKPRSLVARDKQSEGTIS